MPFLRKTTPAASKTSPMSSTRSNLAISQILVANQFDARLPNLFPHAGTDQGVKLIPKFVKRRMGVKLRIARGELRKQPSDEGLVHASVLQQSENNIGVPDIEAGQGRPGARRQRVKNGNVKRAISNMPGGQAQVQPKRIEGQAQALDAELGGV